MKLRCVTLTGADESVHPEDLESLSERYPFVEWGILLSKSREGTPRYPRCRWVDELALGAGRGRFAAHLCGAWSREFLSGKKTFRSEWREAWDFFDRFQINADAATFAAGKSNAEVIAAWFPGKRFIQQVRSFDPEGIAEGFSPLFDCSGGRGESPSAWPEPLPGRYCGYAGRLGPDNLQEALETILAHPGGDCWVCMESQLRTEKDGRSVFDLEKCERCLEIAKPFVEAAS